MARRHGLEVLNREEHDVPAAVKELTQGRGTDAVIDAAGLEAHGSAGAELAQKVVSVLPDQIAEPLSEKVGSTGSARCGTPSRPFAAVAPSRSSGSTAARPIHYP